MKKIIMFLMITAMVLGMTACTRAKQDSSPSAESAASAQELVTAQVQCQEILSDSSILVSASTREPSLAAGDYVLNLGETKLQDAQGNAIAMDAITLGSYLEIQWTGEVMESEPGQISPQILVFQQAGQGTDSAQEPSAADMIGELEQQPVSDTFTEIPQLQAEYRKPEMLVTDYFPVNGGWSWGYQTGDSDEWVETIVDAAYVEPWQYQPPENYWIHAEGVAQIRLLSLPEFSSIQVRACDHTTENAEWIDVELGEDNSFVPLSGEYCYDITLRWEGETYHGSGAYSILITA